MLSLAARHGSASSSLDQRTHNQKAQADDSGECPRNDPNGRDVFSLKPESREFGVTVVIGSLAISCRLGPHSPGGLQLPAAYVKLLPLAGKLMDTGSMVTANGRVVLREARIAADAALGMFEFSKPLVQFADSGESCTIGGQRLTGFSITYDAANARVRLARQGAR